MADEQKSAATYVLDGQTFDDYEGFRDEFNRVVLASIGATWGGDLNAFNDYLSYPNAPWVLVWKNSGELRRVLGHEAMARFWEPGLRNCYSTQIAEIQEHLEAARRGEGQTLFDLIVEIIQDNSEFVTLRLE